MTDIALKSIADDVYPAGHPIRKPAVYETVYEDTLGHLKDTPIRLLELGVHSGHSMQLWHRFFTKAQIVGLDMRDRPDDLPGSRVEFVQGRQEDPAVISRACAGGDFDVIIDDASHIGRMTKESFKLLFDTHLKPGGYYIVEDIAASVHMTDWDDYAPLEPARDEGDRFFSYETGIVGFLKQVVDITACRGHSIQSLCFYQSLAVIRKSPDPTRKGVAGFL